MKRTGLAVAAAICTCLAMGSATAVAAKNPVRVIYKSTTTPLPGNLPSEGAEAYSFNELGDEVTFANGSARVLRSVTVTMSSWACQQGSWFNADCVSAAGSKFSVPITLNLYDASSTAPSSSPVLAGTPIASMTQTFRIPYRPSTNSAKCTGGEWFKKGSGCFNGEAANITFNFSAQDIHLPSTIVFGIAYNTTHYGYSPIGESAPCYTASGGCPYDSLNIALGPKVRVGSKPYPDTLFQNADYQSDYCDGTPTVNVFNLDSPTYACWAGYVPAVQFTATQH